MFKGGGWGDWISDVDKTSARGKPSIWIPWESSKVAKLSLNEGKIGQKVTEFRVVGSNPACGSLISACSNLYPRKRISDLEPFKVLDELGLVREGEFGKMRTCKETDMNEQWNS